VRPPSQASSQTPANPRIPRDPPGNLRDPPISGHTTTRLTPKQRSPRATTPDTHFISLTDSTAVGSLKRPYPLSQSPYVSHRACPSSRRSIELGFCSRKAFVRAFRQDTAKTDRCLVHPAWRRRKTSPNGLTRFAWLPVCPLALRNRQTA